MEKPQPIAASNGRVSTMSKQIKRAAAIGSVLALGAAPGALAVKPADPGSQGQGHGNGHSQAKGVAYVFKGAYQLDSSVAVDHGNAHARKAGLVDAIVAFDLSSARVVVSDVNGDGSKDVNDLSAGDRVVVKAKLPRKDPGDAPYTARQIVDQTHQDSSAD
jgi:hypothetical protein